MSTIRQKVTAVFDKIAAQQPDAIQTGTIQRPAPVAGGGPSDASGGSPGPAPAPIPARMAVFEIGPGRIDGTNILAGDLQVIIEPVSIEITASDKVVCDRGTLTIEKLGRVAPGGETVLYDMICRGSR
ncbi:hypothetical protein RA19_00185 [Leisingera sp. ANG-M1]|uniref:hypothetical protein n=1 Tax=Leisingera sp. ANG-M1 TaxID=1577895 RepID=UPI00057DCA96|nr:hypothetical protein [Leisingera sp. ANG-M1]KIC12862.1 hypothetical protein RA19_00185 [Leisingera sp. ANG-M1]